MMFQTALRDRPGLLGRFRQDLQDRVLRRKQDRTLRIALLMPERHVLEREGEEAGEAESSDSRSHCFKMSAEHFGTHVDAEDGVNAGAIAVRWPRGRPGADLLEQPALFGPVERRLQDQVPCQGGISLLSRCGYGGRRFSTRSTLSFVNLCRGSWPETPISEGLWKAG